MSLVLRVVSFSILGAAALVGTVALIISNRGSTLVYHETPFTPDGKREVTYKVWKGSVRRKAPTQTNQTNQRHDIRLGEVNLERAKLVDSEFGRTESVKAIIEGEGLKRRETYRGDGTGREPVIAMTGVEEKEAAMEKAGARYTRGLVSEEDAVELKGYSPLLTGVVDTKNEDDWTLVSDEEYDDLAHEAPTGRIIRKKLD